MTTQAQDFVEEVRISRKAPRRRDVEAAGGTRLGRFQEDQFFSMPDGSRVILSDPSGGNRLVRAAPAD